MSVEGPERFTGACLCGKHHDALVHASAIWPQDALTMYPFEGTRNDTFERARLGAASSLRHVRTMGAGAANTRRQTDVEDCAAMTIRPALPNEIDVLNAIDDDATTLYAECGMPIELAHDRDRNVNRSGMSLVTSGPGSLVRRRGARPAPTRGCSARRARASV
jgi:hypothetical protein